MQVRVRLDSVTLVLAWNDWYHCMGNTYGTWLPGDARGFRTQWQREHVEGDYRNPPPKGKYENLHRAARGRMTRAPVYLSAPQRPLVLDELLKSLRKWRIDVAAMSVGRVHFHMVARFPQHNPRHFIGLAKKESSAYLKQRALAPTGGLWAERCECVPVSDLDHFWEAFKYILDHAKQGSAVWNSPAAPHPTERRSIPTGCSSSDPHPPDRHITPTDFDELSRVVLAPPVIALRVRQSSNSS